MAERLSLTSPQRRVLDDIVMRFGDRFEAIVAYGSRATGRAWRGSDLDLAIVGAQDAKAETALWLALEESDLPFFFDLTVADSTLEPAMRAAILRDGVPLGGKNTHDWRSLIA